ncbi:uncharacterized protein LOC123559046 isoform X2 [Mercenaria mercenaria]|uniref:uncharacterized protein LOC123559046 isoform X2 n=1 Tax=Mercenaria mercenaria TaxID=6596 RepID=UPI00234EAA03|nr:uncharacterized protein LOC123559046 isoform X2 [Mercenaria mercenaria]
MPGSMLTIILLTSVAVLQLSEAGCPGNHTRTPCDEGNPCRSGWACLGPDGNQTCYKCRCNRISECELNNGNLVCNCENSNGFTGEFCKCPPTVACDYAYLFSGVCTEFYNEFKTIDNVKIRNDVPVIDYLESTLDGCRSKCLDNIDCHLFTFSERDECTTYGPPNPVDILDHLDGDTDFQLRIRKCKKCF